MILKGRTIYSGIVEGEALVTRMGISFFGGVDPETGVIVEPGHELEGQSIAGRVLVFPTGKGSTVGSYTLYRLKKNAAAPLAIINTECETITAVGCIIAEIPCLDQVQIGELQSGQRLRVDAAGGQVKILEDRARSFSRLRPPPNLPAVLRGTVPGSFVEDTMTRRLPGIARRLIEDASLSSAARRALEALIAEMPHGRIRSLRDPGAPDEQLWAQTIAPYVGQTWLEIPWMVGETYFFRRVLEACGYFQPGPGSGADPYRSQKIASMAGVTGALEAALRSLGPEYPSARRLTPADLQPLLVGVLRRVIWGNQADLSLWPVGSDAPDAPRSGNPDAHLLVDDSEPAARYITASAGLERIDLLLDNCGLELAFDLLLADFLLCTGLANEIFFHVKPHPTYVSDVIAADVTQMLVDLHRASNAGIRDLAGRLESYRAPDHRGRVRLQLATHDH